MRSDRVPLLSLVLGYGPALVQLLPAFGAWILAHPYDLWSAEAGRLWAAAILLFLSGVRRGLSFFTEGGPRPIQILTMMWLFLLGLASLLVPLVPALVLLGIGYASIALLDPPAARRGEAPAHFARLRPPQMLIFLAGIAALLAWAVLHR